MEALLDLVMIAYQAPGETAAFLQSLGTIDVPFSLTVVENQSPDPSVRRIITEGAEAVRLLPNCEYVRLLFNEENVGYARASNQGVAHGHAPYVAILNADTLFLANQCCSKIVDFFSGDHTIGIVGPFTTTSQGLVTHAGITVPPGKTRQEHRVWLTPGAAAPREVLNVNTVSGATFFVRRSMWNELTLCPEYQIAAPGAEGALLPTPHFYEETFCCYHARHHGWRVVYYGPASMVHEWHRSSAIGSKPLEPARGMFFAACNSHGISTEGEE